MRMDARESGETHVWRGLLAGAVGGLAGAFLMNQVHSAWSAVERELETAQDNGDEEDEDDDQEDSAEGDEPATAKAAEAVSETVFNHRLTEDEHAVADPAVHYGFGAAMGALYGGLVEWRRGTAALGGVPFATALWLLADEIGVPAAGLSASSLDAPLPTHVRSLLAHIVYGLTTEGVRRGIRAAV